MNLRRYVWGMIFLWAVAAAMPVPASADKTYPVNLDVSAGFGFDSNVPSRPMTQDDDTRLLGFGKGDFFYEHNVTVGYTHPLTSDISLQLQYFLNQNFHFRLGQYDMFSNNISLSPTMRLFDNAAQVVGLFNFNYLDIGSDKYRTVYTVRPVYFHQLTDWLMLETAVGFERYYYSVAVAANQDNPSAKNFLTYLGAYIFLNSQRSAYVQARFSFDANFAAGSNWDYDGYRILIAGVFPIVNKLTGRVYFDLYNQYFNNYWFDAHKSNNPAYYFNNPPFPKREDHGVSTGAQFNYEFYPGWSAQTNLNYTRNNSNIKWYQYDRFIINLLLTFRY